MNTSKTLKYTKKETSNYSYQIKKITQNLGFLRYKSENIGKNKLCREENPWELTNNKCFQIVYSP